VYYPSASGGNQSPIDIVTEDAIVELDYAPGANPLQVNYAPAAAALTGGTAEPMMLVNTGNTARVNVADSKARELYPVYTMKLALRALVEPARERSTSARRAVS